MKDGNVFGIMRAEVADVLDREERFRYRVRVYQLHGPTVPVLNLPYAAVLCFVGGGFGDVPQYRVGDKVAVAFENGNPNHPVIVGSTVTGQKTQTGVTSDFPADRSDPYTTRQKRWDRQDRSGNRVRMEEDTAGPSAVSLEVVANNALRLRTQQGHLVMEINGDGSITMAGDLMVNITGNATIQVGGHAHLLATDIRLGSNPAERVVTEARLAQVYNTHTHLTPVGTSDPPATPIVPDSPLLGVGSPEVRAT